MTVKKPPLLNGLTFKALRNGLFWLPKRHVLGHKTSRLGGQNATFQDSICRMAFLGMASPEDGCIYATMQAAAFRHRLYASNLAGGAAGSMSRGAFLPCGGIKTLAGNTAGKCLENGCVRPQLLI